MIKVNSYRVSLKRDGTLKVRDVACSSASHALRLIQEWYRANKPVGECMLVLGLSNANEILGIVEVARGGVASCSVKPREIFQAALAMNASGFVLSHNHPSGSAEPSAEDLGMTRQVADVGVMLGLPMLDHLVIGANGSAVSIYERLGL